MFVCGLPLYLYLCVVLFYSILLCVICVSCVFECVCVVVGREGGGVGIMNE